MPTWTWDVIGLAGSALVVAGLWMLHPAAGLVAAGGGLIGVSLLGAKKWASSRR